MDLGNNLYILVCINICGQKDVEIVASISINKYIPFV